MEREMKTLDDDELDRLALIKAEIYDLVMEAKTIVNDTSQEDRANNNWVTHILLALNTMQATIESLSQ